MTVTTVPVAMFVSRVRRPFLGTRMQPLEMLRPKALGWYQPWIAVCPARNAAGS